MTTKFDEMYLRLFKQRPADAQHKRDCEDMWNAALEHVMRVPSSDPPDASLTKLVDKLRNATRLLAQEGHIGESVCVQLVIQMLTDPDEDDAPQDAAVKISRSK